jgi:hypothetical protein
VIVLAPAHQAYLLQARQMQALSFAVHIPLVCFGITLPALVQFAEWCYLRSGEEVYRTIARRSGSTRWVRRRCSGMAGRLSKSPWPLIRRLHEERFGPGDA